jgi:lipoprotein signal peptidase
MELRTDARRTPAAQAPVSTLAPPPAAGIPRSVPLRRTSPVAVLAASASTVAVVDLATKQMAVALLGTGADLSLPLSHHAVRLAFVLNDQSAFGVSLGPYTWHINLVLTALALALSVMLCRALSAVDEWAPIMLGLIAGAATGNLVSLIFSPQGVPDFIAVHTGNGQELVFNLADVAAILGFALLLRTVWTVALRARAERDALRARRQKGQRTR